MKIKKIVFASSTYNFDCWCDECEWKLFPTAWLEKSNLQEEIDKIIYWYQDCHDDNGKCRATIKYKYAEQI